MSGTYVGRSRGMLASAIFQGIHFVDRVVVAHTYLILRNARTRPFQMFAVPCTYVGCLISLLNLHEMAP